MSSRFPDYGNIYELDGATIPNAYATTGSKPLGVGGVVRVRFYPRLKLAAGSAITTLKVKLQARYVDQDRTNVLGWNDLPSDRGDAAKTFEIEHQLHRLHSRRHERFAVVLP
jgi:hypothetical protein